MVPAHLKAELLREGNAQRNIQEELLAIWTLLLTEGPRLRNGRLLIADDGATTVGNMLRQSAKSA